MTRRIAQWFFSRGIDPKNRIVAADMSKGQFEATEAAFCEADFDRALPFASASFDLVISIEVIEHLSRPYDFLAEARRVLRTGGRFVFSTLNIFNLQSRLRYFLTGMYGLYEFPTIDRAKGGRLSGHIMPLSLVYLHYGLRRSGFGSVTLHLDKAKNSSIAILWLAWPFLWLGRMWQLRHSRKYDLEVYRENEELIRMAAGMTALTARSIVFVADGLPLTSD